MKSIQDVYCSFFKKTTNAIKQANQFRHDADTLHLDWLLKLSPAIAHQVAHIHIQQSNKDAALALNGAVLNALKGFEEPYQFKDYDCDYITNDTILAIRSIFEVMPSGEDEILNDLLACTENHACSAHLEMA